MYKKTANRTTFVALLLVVLQLFSGMAVHMSVDHPSQVHSPTSIPSILYVGGTGPSNYSRIQDAIDNASEGATIFVYAGTYLEHVNVAKILTIKGESRESVIVDGNYSGTVFSLSAPGITIHSLIIKCSGGVSQDALISIIGEITHIENCTCEQARTGIIAQCTSGISIRNCSFFKVAKGIVISNSSYAKIVNCTFYKNGIGVFINSSSSVDIVGCYGTLNGICVMAESSTRITFSDCNITNSNENQGGIELEHTETVIVRNCTINHCGFGIRLFKCTNTTMTSFYVRDCKLGIDIRQNRDTVTIETSNIYNNDVGVLLYKSHNVMIHNNNIYSNYVADLVAKQSSGDARRNFWGGIHCKIGRIRVFFGLVRITPWLVTPADINSLVISRESLLTSIQHQDNVFLRCNFDNDTDGDNVPDWWEEKYGYDPLLWDDHAHLDPDGDGLNNIEEWHTSQWNSHPFKQDIFIEIDAMDSSFLLSEQKKQELTTRFLAHNITLHIDDGDMGGGEIIGKEGFVSYATLIDFYWTYFLHQNPCSIRKGVFHYVILCESIVNDMPGFVFIGWDEADSFVLNLGYYEERIPSLVRENIKATVFMHELGHTLGLFHQIFSGIDNESTQFPWLRGQIIYHHYESCMNYKYAWQILDYSDGSHGASDFDDWTALDLSFFQNSHWGI